MMKNLHDFTFMFKKLCFFQIFYSKFAEINLINVVNFFFSSIKKKITAHNQLNDQLMCSYIQET